MVQLNSRESILIYYNEDHESIASSKRSIILSLIFIPIFIMIIFACYLHWLNLITYTIVLFVLILTFEFVGLYQQYSQRNIPKCDIKFYDFWSIGHLLLHTFIVPLLYIIYPNLLLSLILSTLVSILWESVEYWRFLMVEKKNYYCESPLNRISDIIFGLIGSTISYIIIDLFFI